MRILMVTPYGKPVVGGISNFVHSLCRVTCVDHSISCMILAQKGTTGQGIVAVNGGIIRFILRGLTLAKRFRPRVIHAHAGWRSLLVSVLLQSLQSGSRAYFTFHTELVQPPRGLRKWLFEALLNRCEGVTFSSRYLLGRMTERFSLPKSRVVSYPGATQIGISEESKERLVKSYGIENHYPILAFIGPLVHVAKVAGVRALIESVRKLVDSGWNPALLVVGGGPHRGSLESLSTSLDLDEFVKFTGFLEDSSVPMACCDIYTHISFLESLSTSVLEAMALRKPVICNDVGGLLEVVSNGETGVIAEPEAGAIASAIAGLAEDKNLMARLGQNAFEFVAENMSWEHTGQTMMDFYSASQAEGN